MIADDARAAAARTPYASSARYYLKLGFSPLPLPARSKTEPPKDWTGRGAPMASAADVEDFRLHHPDRNGNVCLRLPPGVIGVDVDAYKSAGHAAAWQDLVGAHGPLPEAPWSSSRDDGVSGIRLFRVPAGYEPKGSLPGDPSPGEVIRHGHRYVIAAPSVVAPPKGNGEPYRWIVKPRPVSDLPLLPPAWQKALAAAPVKAEPAARSILDLAEGERVHAGPIPYGQHHIQLVAYAGWLRWKAYPLREAEACMRMRLGDCVQPPDAEEPRYTEAEALAELHDVYQWYSAGDSELLAAQNGQGVSHAKPARQIVLTPASDITPEPVVWAWRDGDEGRIPAGSLGLFAGREGTGKSCCLIWLAAKVTKGGLPGALTGPRAVIYVAVEDSWKYTIVPRLIASGADLSLVYRAEVEVFEGDTVSLSLPADNKLLEQVIIERGVAMVVLDPLMSAISDSLDTHVNRQVRQALDPLARLADRTRAVIAGVAHFNKSTGTDASSLITASGAFKDVARFIFAFATDDEDGTHVITQTKNSLGRADLPSLSYKIVTALVPTPLGSAQVGKFELGGETDRTVRDILGTPASEHGEKTRAEDYLRSTLANGPRRTKDVEEEAREVHNISKRTLERARGALRIPSAKLPNGWWISLPEHEGDLREMISQPANSATENSRPAKTANSATPPSPGSLGGVGGEDGNTATTANPLSPWRSGGVGGVAGPTEAPWWCDACDRRHPLGEHDPDRKDDDDEF
jgi:AAA domain/Bifunctional DNA primase/polymerase, N-terminal